MEDCTQRLIRIEGKIDEMTQSIEHRLTKVEIRQTFGRYCSIIAGIIVSIGVICKELIGM